MNNQYANTEAPRRLAAIRENLGGEDQVFDFDVDQLTDQELAWKIFGVPLGEDEQPIPEDPDLTSWMEYADDLE